MKFAILLSLFLFNCGGDLTLTPNGHRVYYQSKDKQFSCYSNICCWPYQEKLMICSQISGYNNTSFFVMYIPDK